MNLILLSEAEAARPLPINDPRALHILRTLRRQPGETFDAGIINGPRGKGTVGEATHEVLNFHFDPDREPPALHPVALLAGLSRPQTMRKILQEGTSLGVNALHFTPTDKSEPSYIESKLWTTGEYRRHLVAGAEQAFSTRIPEVRLHNNFAVALEGLVRQYAVAALDNYEATAPIRTYRPPQLPCLLLVGSERGWSAGERNLIRSHRIPLLHLGANVLRTETAALCGLALLLAGLELI